MRDMDRLSALHGFLSEDPADPFTRFALATEYLKIGDLDRARGFLEGLVRDSPDYVGTYYHLGKLYENIGENDLALQTYRNGIEVASAQKDFHARSELQSALLEAENSALFDDD